MPGIARLFAVADRDSDDHRGSKLARGAPTDPTRIVDLLGGRVAIFAELNLGQGGEAGQSHASGATDDAFFGERSIENAALAVFLLQIQSDAVYAAARANILAKDEQARVTLQFFFHGAADSFGHVN